MNYNNEIQIQGGVSNKKNCIFHFSHIFHFTFFKTAFFHAIAFIAFSKIADECGNIETFRCGFPVITLFRKLCSFSLNPRYQVYNSRPTHTGRDSAMRRDFLVLKSRQIHYLQSFIEKFITFQLLEPSTFHIYQTIVDRFICF